MNPRQQKVKRQVQRGQGPQLQQRCVPAHQRQQRAHEDQSQGRQWTSWQRRQYSWPGERQICGLRQRSKEQKQEQERQLERVQLWEVERELQQGLRPLSGRQQLRERLHACSSQTQRLMQCPPQ